MWLKCDTFSNVLINVAIALIALGMVNERSTNQAVGDTHNQ